MAKTPRTNRRASPATCALVGLAVCSCTGPRLLVEDRGKHDVFLDGRRIYDDEIKFRYYGTTRWDALPADRDGALDWTLRPASQEVAITPPAPAWLFPLDFPLEMLAWTFGGGGDTTTRIVLPTTDAQRRAESELGNAQLASMAERALAARRSRTSP
ncbi:MAG: hypothetical protein ACK501_18260 [Planctomycetota bacterium]